MGGLIAAGLLAIPAVPAVAQSIDIGPGGASSTKMGRLRRATGTENGTKATNAGV